MDPEGKSEIHTDRRLTDTRTHRSVGRTLREQTTDTRQVRTQAAAGGTRTRDGQVPAGQRLTEAPTGSEEDPAKDRARTSQSLNTVY